MLNGDDSIKSDSPKFNVFFDVSEIGSKTITIKFKYIDDKAGKGYDSIKVKLNVYETGILYFWENEVEQLKSYGFDDAQDYCL